MYPESSTIMNSFIFETPEIEDKAGSHLQKLQAQQKTKPESGREISWSAIGNGHRNHPKQETSKCFEKRTYKNVHFQPQKNAFFHLIYFPTFNRGCQPHCPGEKPTNLGQQTPQATRTPQNVATTVAVEPGKPKMILGGVISSRVVGSTPYPKDASPANKGLKGGRSRFPQKSGDVILKKMSS